MSQFLFTLTEEQAQQERTVILASTQKVTPQGNEFKSAKINYADLTQQEKLTYDAFIQLVKSKCI